jgi:putative ABC transport system substrate-binding protein
MTVMRRRDFIGLFGSLACALPGDAYAQGSPSMRHIGAVMPLSVDDPEGHERDVIFRKALEERGWVQGRNVTFDVRWTDGDPELLRKYVAELVALAPDVILAGGGPVIGPLRQASRTIPIVFTNAIDPVARGDVASLARPDANITGFINFEYGFSAKWLELLKQIAPNVTRAAIFRDPGLIGLAQYAAIEAQAPVLEIDVSPIEIHEHEPDKMARAVEQFAQRSDGGLVVTATTAATRNRKLIVGLAARYRLPAVYPNRTSVTRGELISYGPDLLDMNRRAVPYVDRILRGEKPADLPVQQPTKFELIFNLKTAKALGLTVPSSLLASADEVVE